ncbi:hypothetical protein VpaJT1_85 [Vibrio phage VpaJT_1]|nr:hypothetical protein VpaJT1_85 [Vibrio phage VpaJT_1]
MLCASCTTVQTQNEAVQEGLLVRCEPLAELRGGAGSDAYVWALGAVAQYNDCATRHNGLVEVVRGSVEP